MIIYTNSRRLVPEQFAGRAIGPVAFILKKYRDDTGLRAHEQKHIDDFKAAPWKTFWSWLRGDKKWKLRSEVRAFAVQCLDESKPISVYKAAAFIATRYGLDIFEQDAYLLLAQQIGKIERGLA
ncbi:hypothetical protein SYK_06610 [Pseudodesulfovibrio nedwellii]|uniref:Uncharacterized protein n=1 Tax=Pseudodesulfovibrio nedwellii TaxID=2973072 RepID=A0ABM8AXW8_9BACT|nr:hypothetical protein [Pseudodesulfovibrio nedwellii]BDQ36301.1 hypothetical protein SYK_06610 [Pseudodesulfovibrio nedwellii]